MSFLQNLETHLSLIPAITAAIQSFQAIGHTKESAVAKIGQIIQTSAAIGEVVPVPLVGAISATVEEIAGAIFKTPAA
jgi:hypothetical protein